MNVSISLQIMNQQFNSSHSNPLIWVVFKGDVYVFPTEPKAKLYWEWELAMEEPLPRKKKNVRVSIASGLSVTHRGPPTQPPAASSNQHQAVLCASGDDSLALPSLH